MPQPREGPLRGGGGGGRRPGRRGRALAPSTHPPTHTPSLSLSLTHTHTTPGWGLSAPATRAARRGLIIVGSIGAAASLLGCFGTACNRCCLPTYLILGTLVTLAQLGITISLFVNLTGNVNSIANYEIEQDPTWDATPDK